MSRGWTHKAPPVGSARGARLGAVMLSAVSAAGVLTGCGGAGEVATVETPKSAPTKAAAASPAKNAPVLASGARLLPDLNTADGVLTLEDAQTLILSDRMRIVARPDGSLDRAAELMPLGRVSAEVLPDRLGGGFVFVSVGGKGSEVWRADTWLGALTPLAATDEVADERTPVVVGFDRLYLRLKGRNRVIAIDPREGGVLPLAGLPDAPAYGDMVFPDAWRAVVETDLRGVLATFDAGNTWRPLPIADRVVGLEVDHGDAAVVVAGGGRYVVDSRGGVTFRADPSAEETTTSASASAPTPGAKHGPFGRRPLRAAVEDGFPDAKGSAVVARAGALARVSLADGSVLDLEPHAFEETLERCHAVPLGRGFGFVCGERGGATVVSEFVRPLGVREVLRFDEPRFVASSGNGALVVRGSCGDEGEAATDARPYCIRDVEGRAREIRVRGDLGAERLVALRDGRVVVVVPPRPGTSGQLSIIDGATAKHVPLVLPTEPPAAAEEIRRGMWMEGFEERRAGVLGGWVEAGGPVVGVEIDLKGKVTAGEVMEASDGASLLSGRYAVVIGAGGVAAESTDGGMSYQEFDLPELGTSASDDAKTRACGPAGCVFEGWIRTGWGKPAVEGDFEPAPSPERLYVRKRTVASQPLAMSCGAPRELGGPLASVDRSTPARPPTGATRGPRAAAFGAMGMIGGTSLGGFATPPTLRGGPWQPFRQVAAPPLASDEVGFDVQSSDLVSLHAYAWGRRGADWARVGKLLVRFDDRFGVDAGVRSSATSASPWPDEEAAATAIGTTGRGPSAGWAARLDPGGRAALVTACRGTDCDLYSVVDAQPVVELRSADGGRPLLPYSAIRVADTWFFLAATQRGEELDLFRVDLGVARHVRTLFRPQASRFALGPAPRLVRRAVGQDIGLMVELPPDPRERHGELFVLPLDPEDGRVGEPISLGTAELGARSLAGCRASQDGWLLELSEDSPPPSVDAGGSLDVRDLELRVRMDPGAICVDAMAARVEQPPPGAGGAKGSPPGDPSISLAVTERATGRRWALRCAQAGSP